MLMSPGGVGGGGGGALECNEMFFLEPLNLQHCGGGGGRGGGSRGVSAPGEDRQTDVHVHPILSVHARACTPAAAFCKTLKV